MKAKLRKLKKYQNEEEIFSQDSNSTPKIQINPTKGYIKTNNTLTNSSKLNNNNNLNEFENKNSSKSILKINSNSFNIKEKNPILSNLKISNTQKSKIIQHTHTQQINFTSKSSHRTKKNSKEEMNNKQEELSKLVTMFNFDINEEKIKIEENTEYYEMRKEIINLQNKIKESKQELENMINQNKIRENLEKKQIEKFEHLLKKKIEENVENVKKNNKITNEDINILDKKLSIMKEMYEKEENQLNNFINKIDLTNEKLKNEIFYVEDLKEKLKNLKEIDVGNDLFIKINKILKKK